MAAGLAITDVEIIARWLPEQAGAPSSFPGDLMRGLERATPAPVCRAAAELAARTVSVADLYETRLDAAHMAHCFAAVCDVAADHGLRAALEFLPIVGVRGLARACEIVKRADRANGGLVIDLWHLARSGVTAAELAAVPGDRIFSVQLGDAPLAPESDLTLAMMSARRLPGEGKLDLKAMMRALAATGTTAPIGVEVFSGELAALPIGECARRCASALSYCLELAK
jgi:sugar phosphate isomerase/epimerase